MEYSKDINSLLGSSKSLPIAVIEDPKMVLRVNSSNFMWFFIRSSFSELQLQI